MNYFKFFNGVFVLFFGFFIVLKMGVDFLNSGQNPYFYVDILGVMFPAFILFLSGLGFIAVGSWLFIEEILKWFFSIKESDLKES